MAKMRAVGLARGGDAAEGEAPKEDAPAIATIAPPCAVFPSNVESTTDISIMLAELTAPPWKAVFASKTVPIIVQAVATPSA